MIRFNRSEKLINTDLLTPTGGFNFTFKVSLVFYNFKSVFNILCLIYQNIISAFVTAG